MKLSKLTVALVVALLVVATLATTVNAGSVSEDLAAYLTSSHKVGAMTFEMSSFQKDDVNFYLKTNPVTADQAKAIKAEVEAAIATVPEGTKNLNELSASARKDALAHINAAAAVIGATVSIDTVNHTYKITARDGKTISQSNFTMDGSAIVVGGGSSAPAPAGAAPASATTAGAKFVQTGSTVSLFAVVATIAMVAVSAYFVKKVRA